MTQNTILTHKLGRLLEFDERSRNFPIRLMLVPNLPLRSYTWSCKEHLDQGLTPTCVGFAFVHEAIARPKVLHSTSERALIVYHEAQLIDEWPGESYTGTSILAGAKVTKAQGWYAEYRWAFTLDDVLRTIGYKGPVVLGINWYETMFAPDSTGQIRVGGGVVGGHAILANGVSIKNKLIRLHNSWGPRWGKSGDCFISFLDIERLLGESGEVCVPVKRL